MQAEAGQQCSQEHLWCKAAIEGDSDCCRATALTQLIRHYTGKQLLGQGYDRRTCSVVLPSFMSYLQLHAPQSLANAVTGAS